MIMGNMQKIQVIIGTFLLLFITSFLLDLELIKSNFVRVALVYLLILLEVFLGFMVLKKLNAADDE